MYLVKPKKGTTMETIGSLRRRLVNQGVRLSSSTYSLHCSSFFWFNQIYNKDPIRYPQKGTTMETTGRSPRAFAHFVLGGWSLGRGISNFGSFDPGPAFLDPAVDHDTL